MGSLEGRVAVVTGASRGIGAGIATRLAAEGAAVALCARTLEPSPGLDGSLREVTDAITGTGATAVAIQADLSDEDDRATMIPAARDALGPIDILVNNAAAAIYTANADIPLRHRNLTFSVNVQAPMDFAQQVLPEMRERGSGWIVNLTSASAAPPPGPPFDAVGGALGTTITTYGASKAALDRFTVGLAAELWGEGVAVNAVAPRAIVRTPGADALVGQYADAHPELVEPLEQLVEAVLVLCECDATSTGGVHFSGELLEGLGRTVMALDGAAPLDEDA